MKRTVVAIVLLAVCLSVSALAQQPPPMILVYDEVVKPDSIQAYERSSKEFFQILADQMPQAKWSAIMTDDFHYVYVIPIPGMAAIDAMHQEMEKMMKAVGPEKFGRIMEESGKTSEYTNALVLMRRDDLSYKPATALKPEEIKVVEYNFYYLKPGTELRRRTDREGLRGPDEEARDRGRFHELPAPARRGSPGARGRRPGEKRRRPRRTERAHGGEAREGRAGARRPRPGRDPEIRPEDRLDAARSVRGRVQEKESVSVEILRPAASAGRRNASLARRDQPAFSCTKRSRARRARRPLFISGLAVAVATHS